MRALAILLLVWGAGRAQDAPAFAIGGHVTGADGTTRPGVDVVLRDGLAPDRVLGRGRTGSRGRFLVVVGPEDLARREHVYGTVLLVARGPGLAEARALAQAGARDVELVVAPARAIEGRVLDAGRRPVPGALVHALARRDSPRPLALSVRAETTTDEEGRFRFVRFAGAVTVWAVHDQLATRMVRAESGRECVLGLPPLRLGRGRVVDDTTGRGIAGAELRLDGLATDLLAGTAGTTAADGEFAVALIGSRPRWVSVIAAGYHVARVELDAGGPVEVRLKATRGLAGRVVDERDRAVEGARVTLGWLPLVRWTDERGEFRFDTTPRGFTRLEASRPGFLPAGLRVEAGAAADRVTLRLRRGAVVAGVVTRDGQAVMGARVDLIDDSGELQGPAWLPSVGQKRAFGFSDAEGRFLVRGVPADVVRAVAHGPGSRSAAVPLADLEDGVRVGPVRLELKAHQALHGVLRSDAGLPLAGVEVRAQAMDGAVRVARTGADGRFDFGLVPAVPYCILATPERHARVARYVFAGDEVELSVESRLGECSLLVEVDAPPGARVEVRLRRRAEPHVTRRTWGARAEFHHLPAGAYHVEIEAAGCLDLAETVEVAGRSTTCRLAPQRGGTVKLAASPGAAVVVQTLSGRPAPLVALDLERGVQTLSRFGPGRYRFVSRAPGELIVVREVEIGPKQPPVEVELRGGKQSTLVVTARNAVGEPLDGARVTLITPDGFRWSPPERTGGDGQLVLKRLIAGRLEVRAQRGNREGAAGLEVTPGRSLKVEIVLR